MTGASSPRRPQARQDVRAVDGFAYGVVGADLHVFQDRGPVYLLRRHSPAVAPDASSWLAQQPSRLLDARHAVVGFTGRERELGGMAGWRDGPARLAGCWLHAPGGQGKTRLAGEVAGRSAEAGWRVVTAVHGAGVVHPPPGSQDLRPDGACGVLLVVDYADRWPLSHLTWLLSNALLHRDLPARLLLIARTAHGWPAVRGVLTAVGAEASDVHLTPLPDAPESRQRMFLAARDAFALRYHVDPGSVPVPGWLGGPEFGLTLALQMAALVAVDATVSGSRPPRDLPGLSAYLLDRERAHWSRLHENRAEGLDFATSPAELGRLVFTAALTGAVSHRDGVALVRETAAAGHPERALADHSACYPAADPGQGTVLEPLYPDRVAEDYLALSLPGHDLTGHPPDPWCGGVPAALLTAFPGHAARAVTFLASAAARWPHLAGRHLYPLLRADPALAVRAGSAALSALAQLPDVPADVLAAVEQRFPAGQDTDLDPGIADVTGRLAAYQLAGTADPVVTAPLRTRLADRLWRAGRAAQAVAVARDAVADWRACADDDYSCVPSLAEALVNLAAFLNGEGMPREAAEAAGDAAAWLQALSRLTLHDRGNLAIAYSNLIKARLALNPYDGSVPGLIEQTVRSCRALAAQDPDLYEPQLARTLLEAATHYLAIWRPAEAIPYSREAADLTRRLYDGASARYRLDLVTALITHSEVTALLGYPARAVPLAEEAVAVSRDLARGNPWAHEIQLATSLDLLGTTLHYSGRTDDAPAPTLEAVEITRRLAASRPSAYEKVLAGMLDNLAARLDMQSLNRDGTPAGEAVPLAAEAAGILRRLASANPDGTEPNLARVLGNLAVRQLENGYLDDALKTAREGVPLQRRLAEGNLTEFRALLGMSLSNLAFILDGLDAAAEEILAAADEAAGLLRELAVGNPQEHEAYLARTLLIVAGTAARLPGGHSRARRALSEAAGIIELARPGRAQAAGLWDDLRDMAAELQEHLSSESGTEPLLTVSLAQAALGGVVAVTVPGTGQAVRCRLPAGIRSGQRIRLHGQQAPGDLDVEVTVRPHPVFRRDGHHIRIGAPVTMAELANGLVIQVPLLEGPVLAVRIAPGTPPHRLLRVPGRGCRRADGTAGDLLISLDVTPDDIDAAALRSAMLTSAPGGP